VQQGALAGAVAAEDHQRVGGLQREVEAAADVARADADM
jgi:hypothetical protein